MASLLSPLLTEQPFVQTVASLFSVSWFTSVLSAAAAADEDHLSANNRGCPHTLTEQIISSILSPIFPHCVAQVSIKSRLKYQISVSESAKWTFLSFSVLFFVARS